ncbi:MAG TPA: adenylosuccinate synthetase [Candidatus Acidoferrales bacterium]
MSLWVVVGGQFGSEGKGKVSAFITKQENIDLCVRCGGPNSGHSFVDENGRTITLRQLPTGFVNPRTRLLIPAGALIDPTILKKEIEFLSLPPGRIGIDRNCFIIEERDREAERALRLRERLSSTLCGVGAALSRRILRGDDAGLAKDVIDQHPWLATYLTNVSDEVNSGLDAGRKVLIEGTQGFGLSLYHSHYYPHTTSRDTTAAGFLSEVGVSPRLVTEVVVVFRTFPIRVAGQQAGPLKDEIAWEQLQRESGYRFPIEERTSVTDKVRRVARFDWELAMRAVETNRPTSLAVNGLDYLDCANFGIRQKALLSHNALKFLHDLEIRGNVPVGYLGVGPKLSHLIPNRSYLDLDQPQVAKVQGW